MASCEHCGKKVSFNYGSLFGGIVLCSKCEKDADDDSDLDWSQINIVGNGVDNIPDEIKQKILSHIRDNGLDPEDGLLVALDIKKLLEEGGPEAEETLKQLEVMAARVAFTLSIKTGLAAIHGLHHIGIPDSELKPILKRLNSVYHEVLTDYLFLDHPDAKSEEELLEMSYDACLDCKVDHWEDMTDDSE